MRFIIMSDSDKNTKYICENGKIYSPLEVLQNEAVHYLYMRGLKTYIHETELNGKRVNNALRALLDPTVKAQYRNLYPALYDDAFNILWREANKCVN